MTRRICLVSVANDFLDTFLLRLPPDVSVSSSIEQFDRASTIVRLEGNGLPEWCEEPSCGGQYAIALMLIGGDGKVRFVPAGHCKTEGQSVHERIVEEYSNPN